MLPSNILNQANTHLPTSFPLPRLASFPWQVRFSDYRILNREDLSLIKVALHDAKRVTNNIKTTQAYRLSEIMKSLWNVNESIITRLFLLSNAT